MSRFESHFGIGQAVMALRIPATVVAVKFTESKVIYEVEFDAGGANSTLDSIFVEEVCTKA